MSIVLDGSNGVTFPNGSNPQAAPSKVLQVVSAVNTTAQNYSNQTSAVTTGTSATITPLFSTSKILILVSISTEFAYASNANNGANLYIYKNGSSIATFGYAGFAQIGVGNNGYQDLQFNLPITYLDSPATTSSVTYTIYGSQNNSSNAVLRFQGTATGSTPTSTITLMEIAQ